MPAKLIKPASSLHDRKYSNFVREKLDPRRPKYSEAVKSLAAFAPDERKFNVLVSHLDAACQEARREGENVERRASRHWQERYGK